jgi:signal transduction histidine kinase
MPPSILRRSAEWAELHTLLTQHPKSSDADPVDELLAEERVRAEGLLNRVRAAVLIVLAVAALLYAPRITPSLSAVNAAVLVPMLVWTVTQHAIYHRHRSRNPRWSPRALGAINATVDITALTLLQAGYAVFGTPELAVRSPIFLVYFVVLASRPFTGSARHAAAVTLLAAGGYIALVAELVVTGRLPLVANPLAALSGSGTSLLNEGAKVLLLLTVGAISVYATAWNERALRRALAVQVARETEAREVTTRLQEADKLAAIGTLAAATVHEVRNPLTAIGLQAELLLATTLTDEQRSDVAAIAADARRTASFLTDLLRVARSAGTEDAEVGPVCLVDVVDAAVTTARPLLREQHVDVSVDSPVELPDLRGSGQRLERALLNLVMNAVQAMEGQQRPKAVRIRVRADVSPAAATNGSQSNGNPSKGSASKGTPSNGSQAARVTLDVEDTGPGFPPGAEIQAFEQFYTTKPAGRGTGLGLWIVRETVATFGGTVAADRGAEGGAIVRLSFPIEST